MRARLPGISGRRIDPVKLDLVVAGALAVGCELEAWFGSLTGSERLVVAVAGPLMAGTVAIRRRSPGAAGIGAALLADVVAIAWKPPSVVSYGIAWLCSIYALTVWTRPRVFAIGVAAMALPTLLAVAITGEPRGGVSFTVITIVVMLFVRRVVGDRERRVQMAERERDLAAREAVVEERARIARELHDVIAHHVSMMVIQAGAERRVLEAANAPTGEVLQTIEQIGRNALTEMRRLLGMLRSGDAPESLTPQPGLRDVPTLVTQLREAGLPVELSVDGERRELAVGIELSAYRIVQEALTNALKHAGNAQASVHVRYGVDSLELEIVDDGRGTAASVSGGGHGLVGMRERVALYGGRLDAGRSPSGGFAVRVLLPIR
ncbi:MAG TPA: sensor histidine kinase [Gaiellaceae bacterium]|nr:sensor histidine kinase [Gaiellaceae bacterium]